MSKKSTERYLISVASYRRPQQLKKLLDSIHAATTVGQVDVVVVDNDAEESAREVATSHDLAIRYLVEKTPGIASARNAGMSLFTEDYVAVIFVDDDEWVDESWFREITSFAAEYPADVVHGPVVSVFPEGAPSWVEKGNFFQRPSQSTGAVLPSAATNNTLLYREAWVRAGSPLFDIEFSSTGGSDWDFFWGIRKSGSTIRFAPDALVFEAVPDNRMTSKWIRQRFIRNGIVNTRVRMKHGEPIALPLIRGIARMGFNAVLVVKNLALSRGFQAKPVNAVLHEYGKLSGLLGHRIHEYKRPAGS